MNQSKAKLAYHRSKSHSLIPTKIFQCNTLTIMGKKNNKKLDRNKLSTKYLHNEETYIVYPQGIRVTDIEDCNIRTWHDCVYEVFCKKCNYSFKMITFNTYAIITLPRVNYNNYKENSCLRTNFPFQLRPFIKVDRAVFYEEEESIDEDDLSYEMEQEDSYILPNELIVGDIPCGFLVF